MKRNRLQSRLNITSLALMVAAVLVALAACTSTASAPTATPSPPGPAIKITAPADGSTVPAGNITVTVQVSNFNLVDKLGQANAPDQGHIHYFMDVDAPITPGKPAVTPAGTYAATAATSYAWPNVTPGTHTFSVELVNNDHTPLIPEVVDEVTITVSAAGSSRSLASSGTGGS